MHVILYILIPLSVVIASFIIWLITLPSTFRVKESINLKIPLTEAFNYLLRMDNHIVWSPWLMHNPSTNIEYSARLDQPTSFYSWDDDMLGAGKLMHRKIEQNKRIDQDIEFYRPFKSKAKVTWEFEQQEGSVRVSWVMDSSMPLFLRWMIPMLEHGISSDYRLGLVRLAHVLDDTATQMDLSWDGAHDQPSVTGVFEGFSGDLAGISQAFDASVPKLNTFIDDHKLPKTNKLFGVYHSVNVAKRTTDMKVLIQLDGDDNVDRPVYTIPSGKYYQVTYKGSMQNMDLAWYAAYQHLRMLKYKLNTKMPALEEYFHKDEAEISPEQLESVVLLIPLR